MFDIFQLDGTCQSDILLIKISIRGLVNGLPIDFMSLGDISSGPLGFEVFRACRHVAGPLHLAL